MLLAVAFGLAIGVAVGMLGGGGSVLAVPVLVYLLDQDVSEATTASLLVVAVGAVAGGLGHARAGRVCWRHAGSFTAAALPGIVAGTAAGAAVGGSALLGGFAVIMLAAAAATWRKARADSSADPAAGDTCPPLRLPRGLAAGAGTGLLTGFFGVGGGFLIVPTLAVGLAFTMRTAVGTSLVIITATSLLGFITHLAAGRGLDVQVAVVMAAACAMGALLGVVIGARIPQRALGRGFAVLLLGVAVWLVISVTALGGP